jgi:repressor LexA
MREQGVISHEPRKSRGITLLKPTESAPPVSRAVRVPLIGAIAAGMPIEANALPDEFVDLAESIAGAGDVYALRVKGTSMIDDHIDDGDIVIVRRQTTAQIGETVVALLSNNASETGEATLKRFRREKNGQIRLEPRNPAVAPIIVDERDVRIQGKVIAVLRQI